MSMSGMNSSSGHRIDGTEHISQSVHDILTTRIGTRCMRRDYGSLVPELIDQPSNAATQLRLMAATVMAVIRWEPRIIITEVKFFIGMDGKATLNIDCVRRDGPRSGQSLNLAVQV